MTFLQCWQELLGVPGMNFKLAQTKYNEGLNAVYDDQLWSFQMKTAGWYTPGLLTTGGSTNLSPGLITVNTFGMTVTGNAAASAAWLGITGMPLITQYQIRSPYYSLYSIVSVNSTVPTAVVLTLDRPWMEPPLTLGSYMMYQCYFPVPNSPGQTTTDFKKFLWARDTTNNSPMNYWKYTQSDLANMDPERTVFDQPAYIVPYQPDNRAGSPTYGAMLFELWPHPLNNLPYTYGYLNTGPLMVNPTDTVPYPLTEDLVKMKAYSKLYLWKESQKGDEHERGAGANWLQLATYAEKEYQQRKKQISLKDQLAVDLYWSKFNRWAANNMSPFATVNSQLNVGTM